MSRSSCDVCGAWFEVDEDDPDAWNWVCPNCMGEGDNSQDIDDENE